MIRLTQMGFRLAAAFAVSAPAVAADLPSHKSPPPAPVVESMGPLWSGGYVGGFAGGAFGGSAQSYSATSAFLSANLPGLIPLFNGLGSQNLSTRGLELGLEGGYDWRVGGAYVLGVAGDVNWSNLSGSVSSAGTLAGLGFPYTMSQRLTSDWRGSARLRAGVTPLDNLLLYATGGLAYGTPVAPAAINSLVPAFFGSQSSSAGTAIGWAAGGGVEFAVTNNWSIKGEYLYASLGSKSVTYNTTILPVAVADKTGEHTARVGVNYHFNMGAPGGYVKY